MFGLANAWSARLNGNDSAAPSPIWWATVRIKFRYTVTILLCAPSPAYNLGQNVKFYKGRFGCSPVSQAPKSRLATDSLPFFEPKIHFSTLEGQL